MKTADVELWFTASGKWALFKKHKLTPYRIGTTPPDVINEFIIGMLLTLSGVTWVEVKQVTDDRYKSECE